ncbi:DUF262 domain-containing protein [Bacillus sp. J33]|uniref:DUF262 domain-containing protein n=1 Tax=Bacillus sp. J33 TaxID=935836 RepID=UPI00047CB205|nr:DUF262 domain-containing protein [Bacillus sp. J33]
MKISAQGRNLRKIFEEKVTYEIPDYQRPYSWSKQEIEDLFTDLDSIIHSESIHYFGAFVFNDERRNDYVIEVIDGQQRLTTIAIFLYVLRYIYSLGRFKSFDGVEHRSNKLKEYLEFLDDDGQMVGSKLKLGELNNEFFEEYIVKAWSKSLNEREDIVRRFKVMEKYNASKQIKEAFQTILDKVNNRIKDLDDNFAIKYIKEIHEALLKKFEVVEIIVEQDADAFLIFETLNDRGLELSSVDLIKNRLFKNCSSYRDFNEIKEKWINMIRIVDDSVKKYLRHYWIANYELVSYPGLFKAVRLKADTYEISKKLINELYELAPYYNALHNPSSDSFGNTKLKRVLENMNKLNFDLTHPILIAGIERYKADEEMLYKLVRLCLNFLIRYITVMKEKPGVIEKEIGILARDFKKDGDISKISSKFQELAKDSEFKEKMISLTVNYRSPSTFFILTEYEKALHTEDWIAPERAEVTVEHILPKTVDFNIVGEGEWATNFTLEEHEVYLDKLGNLTLLGPSAQGRAGNKKFKDKQSVYKTDTDMLMTQGLTNYVNWTKKEIEERQIKIAEEAVKIFTLKVENIK